MYMYTYYIQYIFNGNRKLKVHVFIICKVGTNLSHSAIPSETLNLPKTENENEFQICFCEEQKS